MSHLLRTPQIPQRIHVDLPVHWPWDVVNPCELVDGLRELRPPSSPPYKGRHGFSVEYLAHIVNLGAGLWSVRIREVLSCCHGWGGSCLRDPEVVCPHLRVMVAVERQRFTISVPRYVTSEIVQGIPKVLDGKYGVIASQWLLPLALRRARDSTSTMEMTTPFPRRTRRNTRF